MKLKVGEHNYKIWFEYKHGFGETNRGQIYDHRVNCHLVRELWGPDGPLGDEKVATGFSLCKVPDKFVKETGRKRALTSALRRTSFDRDERRQFWEAYHNRARAHQLTADLEKLKRRGV